MVVADLLLLSLFRGLYRKRVLGVQYSERHALVPWPRTINSNKSSNNDKNRGMIKSLLPSSFYTRTPPTVAADDITFDTI